jgi:small subunit ribosomal protein S1
MMDETSDPNHPMNLFLSEDFSLDPPKPGESRQGLVVASRNNEVLVDIGAKSEGIITANELIRLADVNKDKLAVGESVTVIVMNPEDRDGNIIVSFAKALEEEDWKQAQELLDSQDVYEGTIVGYNRGGVLVMMGNVRGFVPASQLSRRRHSGGAPASNEERLRSLVGEEIMARVIEVDRSRNRLILSERAALREIRAAQRSRILLELEVGAIMDGRIVNLADFGAFVDIGGLEGLVHLSELSWKRVNHPSEVLEVGEQVKVHILNVDHDRQRVALSLKRLEPDPWTLVNKYYREGELVEATVTKLTKYGAFARLNDEFELEGLIHVSELSDEHVEHPQDIVSSGQIVAARIIRVDAEQRQLGLSIKKVASPEFLESDLAFADDVEVE